MMAVIIFILLSAIGAVSVLGMWFLGAMVESKTHKSFYYEDLPEDFDFEKFKQNRQVIYAITGAVTAILSAVGALLALIEIIQGWFTNKKVG